MLVVGSPKDEKEGFLGMSVKRADTFSTKKGNPRSYHQLHEQFLKTKIKDEKKSTHHLLCQVEFLSTSLARSAKNAAVVFKSKFGGTCTQFKVLSASNEKLTAHDIAQGYHTFEYAVSIEKIEYEKICDHMYFAHLNDIKQSWNLESIKKTLFR